VIPVSYNEKTIYKIQFISNGKMVLTSIDPSIIETRAEWSAQHWRQV